MTALINKYEIVDSADLKKNDIVTIISLLDSGVITRDAVVSYTGLLGGFDYKLSGSYSGSCTAEFCRNIVILRKIKSKPANWPPVKHDVWKFGSKIYHAASCNSMYNLETGRSENPETLLSQNDNAELLFRLNK